MTVERPQPQTRRAALRGDRGISTLESLGIVAVAVLLVTGAVIGMSAYPSHISAALCRFATAVGMPAGSCDVVPPPTAEDGGPTDEDLRPPVCMLSETSEQYSAEVKVWFLSFGENSGFIVQEFSDGSVRATMTDGASVGASGEVSSGTFDAGKLGGGDNAGYEVSLGADLKFSYGDTWEFESKEQWESMRGQLDDYLLQQEMLKQEGGVWAIKGSGGFVDPPKDREISFSKVELEAALNASIGLRDPLGTKNEKGEDEFFNPNVGAHGSLTAGGAVILETNHKTGERSWTYELSGSVAGGVDLVGGSAEGSLSTTGAFTVTRDASGELTQIVFQSTREGGVEGSLGNDSSFDVGGSGGKSESTMHVTTTTLDVTDANRDLAESWLASTNDGGTTLSLTWDTMVPDKPSDDPFLQLLYEEARTSDLTYHNVQDKWAFEAAIKKGWQFGFAISAEEATATIADANFLGAPAQDGVRPMIPDAECAL